MEDETKKICEGNCGKMVDKYQYPKCDECLLDEEIDIELDEESNFDIDYYEDLVEKELRGEYISELDN